MTTIAELFAIAQERIPANAVIEFRHAVSFVELKVGDATWHGQINLAKDHGRPWCVTIYLLCTTRKSTAVGFQEWHDSPTEALAIVERKTQEWAQAQEQPTP